MESTKVRVLKKEWTCFRRWTVLFCCAIILTIVVYFNDSLPYGQISPKFYYMRYLQNNVCIALTNTPFKLTKMSSFLKTFSAIRK